jgi:hypothetical protein
VDNQGAISSLSQTNPNLHLRSAAIHKDIRHKNDYDAAVEEYQNQNDDNLDSGDSGSGDSSDEMTVRFPILDQDEYLGWVHAYYKQLEFETTPKTKHKLNKSMLDESLQLGCDYIAANQNEGTGNFNYQYDFVKRKIRQAGALWGATLCFQSQPNNGVYRAAVEKGFAFFQDHMIDGPVPGSHMIEYPGFDDSQSGVNALYGLALIDYLRTIRDNPFLEADDSIEAARISIRDLARRDDGIGKSLCKRINSWSFDYITDIDKTK